MTNEERFKAIFQDQVNRPGADDLLEWLENAAFSPPRQARNTTAHTPAGLSNTACGFMTS